MTEIGGTMSHYRILEKLGEGGMGVVYRAEDTNLGRQVAVKVLPDIFSCDPERLARFEREARLLASLNHPNIATIHGLEQAEEKRFLVLELVEGETLAQRLLKGPLPVEEALEVCRQVAEGLEAAHEKGVIHRDLKPANIRITPEGKVKILDFGLAKAFQEETATSDLSQSPTLTAAMTRAGVILGTAAYMSPEQAKGKSVDKRTDIWAFGCILYECFTARRAFEAETVTETLAAVLTREPLWDSLAPSTPSFVRSLLRRCLEKNVAERLRDIGEARIDLRKVRDRDRDREVEQKAFESDVEGRSRISRITVAAIAMAAIVLGVLAAFLWLRVFLPPVQIRQTRLSVRLPKSDTLLRSFPPALSPNGEELVFIAKRDGVQMAFRRSLDGFDVIPIEGTEGATWPFFSPGGRRIGFFAENWLRSVPLEGGTPQPLCQVRGAWLKGSWGRNRKIVFCVNQPSELWEVSEGGGTAERITSLDSHSGESAHRWPDVLPNGKAVLFNIVSDSWQIAVYSEETHERWSLGVEGLYPTYVASGHILFSRGEGSLWAVPFDKDRLKITGEARQVFSGLGYAGIPQWPLFAVANDATLAYVPGVASKENMLLWVDRNGHPTPIRNEPGNYQYPRISPDGKHLAVTIETEIGRDLYVIDLERPTLKNGLTSEGSLNVDAGGSQIANILHLYP